MFSPEIKRVTDAQFELWLQTLRANCSDQELYEELRVKFDKLDDEMAEIRLTEKLYEESAEAEREKYAGWEP